MRQLNCTAQSRRDLYAINSWLTGNADLHVAIRIVTQIRDRAGFLLEYPLGGASDLLDTRRLRVPNTPYLILYRVREVDRIDIVRVRHARENRSPFATQE